MLIKPKYFRSFKIALCVILSSCSVQPSYDMETINISQDISSAYIPRTTKNIMLLAEQEQDTQNRNNYYIYAINSLMSKKQLPKVEALWPKIDETSLNAHQAIALEMLKAKALLLQNKNNQAIKKLRSLAAGDSLTTQESNTISAILSTAYKNKNDLVNFIRYYTKASDDDKALLSTLTNYSVKNLQANIAVTNNRNIKGWLELAILAQTSWNKTNIARWQQDHVNHSGNNLIIANDSYSTHNIAIMLPFKGEMAKTSNSILQGFFAEYYQNTPASVIVIDTSDSSFNEELKKLTQTSTPDIIVGPITKEEVDNIDPSIAPASLILALNSSSNATSNNLIHFSLTPKDETNKIAQDAFRKGINHAMVFTSEEPWQKNISEQFTQSWEDLAGKVTVQYVNNVTPLAAQLKKSLSIDESENRAKKLEQIIDQKLKFTPSRRTDIDMIFLATSPRQARQIKPLLKYYFAGDIPVYSTSTIFNTASNSYKDVDLNDIRFCDSTWIVTNNPKDPVQQELKKLWPKDFSTHKRLFAMGGDIAKITSNINTLTSIDGSVVKGYTGRLSLEDDNILRQLQWFKFYNGTPRLTTSY